jgi:hypothetical protein
MHMMKWPNRSLNWWIICNVAYHSTLSQFWYLSIIAWLLGKRFTELILDSEYQLFPISNLIVESKVELAFHTALNLRWLENN